MKSTVINNCDRVRNFMPMLCFRQLAEGLAVSFVSTHTIALSDEEFEK